MPNWAYNKIYARNETDFEKLKDCLLNGGEADFNRIVPMPHELEEPFYDGKQLEHMAYAIGRGKTVDRIAVCGYIRDRYPNVVFTKHGNPVDVTPDESTAPRRFFDLDVADQIAKASECIDDDYIRKSRFDEAELRRIGKKRLHTLIKYGAANWYDWCCLNWGTKWNAHSTSVDDDALSIYFETAWASVSELMCKLSEKADMSIYMEYSEEQFSEYAGEAVFEKGKTVDAFQAVAGTLGCYRIAAHMQDADETCHRFNGDILFDDDDEFATTPKQPEGTLESAMYASFMAGEYHLDEIDR